VETSSFNQPTVNSEAPKFLSPQSFDGGCHIIERDLVAEEGGAEFLGKHEADGAGIEFLITPKRGKDFFVG
jgi:hypothetical protein